MLYFFCFMMFHEMKGDDFIHVYSGRYILKGCKSAVNEGIGGDG